MTDGCGEDEVQESEAEEGDMTEAGEAAAVRSVAAHPVFAMEEETEDGAGEDSGEHAKPSGDEVEGWRLRDHACLPARERGCVRYPAWA